jgi:hypothetical protein
MQRCRPWNTLVAQKVWRRLSQILEKCDSWKDSRLRDMRLSDELGSYHGFYVGPS